MDLAGYWRQWHWGLVSPVSRSFIGRQVRDSKTRPQLDTTLTKHSHLFISTLFTIVQSPSNANISFVDILEKHGKIKLTIVAKIRNRVNLRISNLELAPIVWVNQL